MKRFFLLALLFAFTHTLISAQPVCTVKYQAVARDADDNVLPSRNLGIQIKIHTAGPDGVEIYTENHAPTTTSLGLFNLEIGAGESVSGVWEGIDWSVTTYYMEVLMDVNGGSDYKSLGVSPILAVPIASYAKNSSPQCLEFTTTAEECGLVGQLSITGKEDTFYLQDLDPTNELQHLWFDQQIQALILSDPYQKQWDTIVIPVGGSVPDPLVVTKLSADTICTTNEEEATRIVNDGNSISIQGEDFVSSWGVEYSDYYGYNPALFLDLNEYSILLVEDATNELRFGILPELPIPYRDIIIDLTPYSNLSVLGDTLRDYKYFTDSEVEENKPAITVEVTSTSCTESWIDCNSQLSDLSVCRQVETRCIGPNTTLLRETNGCDGVKYNCSYMNDGGEEALECSWQSEGYNISNKTVQVIVDENSGRILLRDQDNNIVIRIDSETGAICANEFKTNIPQANRASDAVTTMYSSLSLNAEVSIRGSSQLSSGTQQIYLSEDFTATVNMKSMTVTLTPHSAESYGLAVVEKNSKGFVVKELAGGQENFGFDWEVKCDRLELPNQVSTKNKLEDLDAYIQQKLEASQTATLSERE